MSSRNGRAAAMPPVSTLPPCFEAVMREFTGRGPLDDVDIRAACHGYGGTFLNSGGGTCLGLFPERRGLTVLSDDLVCHYLTGRSRHGVTGEAGMLWDRVGMECLDPVHVEALA